MKFNYFQLVPELEGYPNFFKFRIKAYTLKGHSYWTLSGATPKIENSHVFTRGDVAPMFEGYLHDGDYDILPVCDGAIDVCWWLDALCEQFNNTTDNKTMFALGELMWNLLSENITAYEESMEQRLIDYILDIKDTIALLSIAPLEEAESIVGGAVGYWMQYRRVKEEVQNAGL